MLYTPYPIYTLRKNDPVFMILPDNRYGSSRLSDRALVFSGTHYSSGNGSRGIGVAPKPATGVQHNPQHVPYHCIAPFGATLQEHLRGMAKASRVRSQALERLAALMAPTGGAFSAAMIGLACEDTESPLLAAFCFADATRSMDLRGIAGV